MSELEDKIKFYYLICFIPGILFISPYFLLKNFGDFSSVEREFVMLPFLALIAIFSKGHNVLLVVLPLLLSVISFIILFVLGIILCKEKSKVSPPSLALITAVIISAAPVVLPALYILLGRLSA